MRNCLFLQMCIRRETGPRATEDCMNGRMENISRILNILDSFREIYGTDPSIVVSGFHMIQSEYTEEDLQKIRDTADELSQMNTIFYSGHCTGEAAYQILKGILGDKLRAIRDLQGADS